MPAATLNPEALYMQLGRLVEELPDLNAHPVTPDTMRWLGRAYALVLATGDTNDAERMKREMENLQSSSLDTKWPAAEKIPAIVHRALALAELNAPIAVQGAFLPTGSSFDAMAAVGKILQVATSDVLIVDPYMDQKTLTDFVVLVPEAVPVRLLADEHDKKASLEPAVRRWAAQYGAQRPLEARLAPGRTLHDRLIAVDCGQVWTLTQSLNAIATRAPASIVRADEEVAKLKVAAYDSMWQSARVI